MFLTVSCCEMYNMFSMVHRYESRDILRRADVGRGRYVGVSKLEHGARIGG